MRILQVISRLMHHPDAELFIHVDELEEAISSAKGITPQMRTRLAAFLEDLASQNIMDVQETYDALFEKGRALSLLLFEHVHGESRARGQAMVDLMAVYQTNGFVINVQELPDYIPLYLEYLAQRPELEAREGLCDVQHILALLSARLQERGSPYHCLFDALLMIAGVQPEMKSLLERAAGEERDDTPEALDKIWEEEAVTFGMDSNKESCPSRQQKLPSQGQSYAEAVRWVGQSQSLDHSRKSTNPGAPV